MLLCFFVALLGIVLMAASHLPDSRGSTVMRKKRPPKIHVYFITQLTPDIRPEALAGAISEFGFASPIGWIAGWLIVQYRWPYDA